MKRPLLVLALLVGMFASARLLVPASAATYTQVNSPASVNWNTAPWDNVEPTYANARVGLLRGGGTMEINTDEGGGGLLVGWLGTYTVNMTGGSLTLGSADYDTWLFLSENGTGRGTFNQTGGTVQTPGVIFNRNGGADLGHYSLGGTGVLNTGAVARAQGTATFDFNGGTLEASVHNGNWVDSGITINVQAGGAVIDTQAFDVTVNSALLDGGGGGGLVKYGPGVLRLNGSNTYTGTTTLDQGYLVLHQSSTYDGLMLFGTAGAYRRLDLWDGNTQTFRGLSSPDNANTDIYNDPGSAMASLILDVPTGESYTYGGTLGIHGNPFSLTKRGPGTQVLAGSVNHIGGTTVEAGTLQIGSGEASTSVGAGGYSVAGGATLVFNRNIDNTLFTNQSIGGNGDVVFRGQQNGYFTFRQGQYTGALTYTGRTVVNLDDAPGNQWYQGTLWVEKDDLLPHGTILEFQSGKVFLRNSETSGQTVAGLVGNAGTFITTDQGTIQKLNVDVAATQSYTFAGMIGSGEGNNNLSFAKSGPGTQILSGANTYTGGTTVSGGTLQLGDGGTTGTVPGTIVLSNGATLALDHNVDYAGRGVPNVTGDGNLLLLGQANGYYSIRPGATTTLNYTGTTTVQLDSQSGAAWRGALFVEPGSVGLPAGTVLEIVQGKVDLRQNQTVAGLTGPGGFVTTDSGYTATLTVNVAGGETFTYGGVIGSPPETGYNSAAVALVKAGPGTQILTGNSNHTGGTTVAGGMLLIDGSVAGNVLVTGGLLGGDGSIGGNVDIQAGGAISAGGSPGHLAVGGIYTQSGTMLAELGGLDQGINYDWIEVDGTATLSGLVDVDFYDSFQPSLGDTFDILTAAGGITNADLGGVTFDFSGATGGPRLAASIVTLAGDGEALRLSAVPEPSTLLLLVVGGLGLAGLALRRRRR